MICKKTTVIAATALSAGILALPVQAIDFKVSGQISRMIMAPDDFQGDEIQHVDNNVSGTRIRVKGEQDMGSGMKVGGRYELQLQDNKASAVNGGSVNEESNSTLDVRYSDIYLSGGFGKFSLGKGDGAGNGATESDLSGTYIAAAANFMDSLGGLQYADGKTVGSVYAMYDAFSRNNRVRYDSPKFAGFSVAYSSAEGSTQEFAIRYGGEVSGVKVKAAYFMADAGDSSRTDSDGGSVSALLPMGVSLTIALSSQDATAGDDPSTIWYKLGYKFGKHAVSIDAGDSEDVGEADASTVGVAYNYTPIKGVEMFVGHREIDVDLGGATDPSVTTIGGRVKF